MMTSQSHDPTDEYEAFLDAMVGIELALIALEARVGLVSGVRRATPPGKTRPLAIDTTMGEVRAGTRVARLPHDIMTIETLDEGPTGGDL